MVLLASHPTPSCDNVVLILHRTRKMALEEEAAKARERRERQDEEVKQDSGAIELGDTRLSMPDSGGETALPEGSTA